MFVYFVALAVAIPLILFPVAFVWFLNISGIYQVIKDKREKDKRVAIRGAKRQLYT